MAAKGCIRACIMHQPRTMCPEIKVEEGNLCGQCPEQCRISSGKVAETNRCRQKLESESVDLNLNLHVELAASQSSRAL